MSSRAARLAGAVLVLLGTCLTALTPPRAAVAGHLPPPREILIGPGDLPAGFEPVSEADAPALLPDGLARQATVTFRRDAEGAPGPSYVRQVVLAFDERPAEEYLPRFRDLMSRHQGFAVVGGDETGFQLVRERADETAVAVGSARGEVLVITTVTGPRGSVTLADAATITDVAALRVPVLTEAFAAHALEPERVSLAGAETGQPHLELPRNDATGRWPLPVVDLPPPPPIAVAERRSSQPAGAPELAELMPIQPTSGRPEGWPADLHQYAKAIGPLIDEFWTRTLAPTRRPYRSPGFVVVPEGTVVMTACLDYDGEPAPALSLSYCGVDETVYIYEPFLRDELIAGPSWRERDFVVATVLAHEWAHHVQNLLGVSDAASTVIGVVPEAWPLVTRQKELQADCSAGLFARYARDRGWLNVGDLAEGQEAAFRAGDTHFGSPGHHGTPEQRREWFTRGYVHYALSACEPW